MSERNKPHIDEAEPLIAGALTEGGHLDASSLARAETIAAQKGVRVDQVLPGLVLNGLVVLETPLYTE